MKSLRSKCGRIFRQWIVFSVFYVSATPIVAKQIELESIRRLATTCLRVAGHQHSRFIVTDPRTAKPVEIKLRVADLRQIALTGTVIRNGQAYEAVRPVMINPENILAVEQAVRDQTLQNYLDAFRPVEQKIQATLELFAPGKRPTEENFLYAKELLSDLHTMIDRSNNEATGPDWTDRPAGHLITMISAYSPNELERIERLIDQFTELVRERAIERAHARDRTDQLSEKTEAAIASEIFRVNTFLRNLRNSRGVRILR